MNVIAAQVLGFIIPRILFYILFIEVKWKWSIEANIVGRKHGSMVVSLEMECRQKEREEKMMWTLILTSQLDTSSFNRIS